MHATVEKCKYICMHVFCLCVSMYMYVCMCICVHVWSTCVSMLCVGVNVLPLCVFWWRVTAFQTRSDDPNSVTGDSNLYPFGTRYNGDSKIDPWDDP